MKTSEIKIAVVGLWHQGCVAAACLAEAGYSVTAYDPKRETVAALRQGRAPLYEPGLEDLIAEGRQAGRLDFISDLAAAVKHASYVFITFDTPVDDQDQIDLTELFQTIEAMAPHLQRSASLLVTAQVPVGTCEEIIHRMRKVHPQAKFGLAYSPENLRLGQALDLYRKPALPVIGSDDPETLDRIAQLLSVFETSYARVSLRTAEMTKHALNAFLAACIVFGNELGNLCDETGADAAEVAKVLRREPRISPKAMIFPGLGFSGGTLARDVQVLRNLGKKAGMPTPFLEGLWQSNARQNESVLRRLEKWLPNLDQTCVAVLGLTYKPGTSTLRRSVALEIIGELVRRQVRVQAHDPHADREEIKHYPGFRFHEDPYEAAVGASAILLITPWPEYRELDYEKMKLVMAGDIFFDTANLLDAGEMGERGFTYYGIGRGQGSGK